MVCALARQASTNWMEYAPGSPPVPQGKLGTASNARPSSVLPVPSGTEPSVPLLPQSTVLLAPTMMGRSVSLTLPTALLVLLGQVHTAKHLIIVPTAHTLVVVHAFPSLKSAQQVLSGRTTNVSQVAIPAQQEPSSVTANVSPDSPAPTEGSGTPQSPNVSAHQILSGTAISACSALTVRPTRPTWGVPAYPVPSLMAASVPLFPSTNAHQSLVLYGTASLVSAIQAMQWSECSVPVKD